MTLHAGKFEEILLLEDNWRTTPEVWSDVCTPA